MSLKPYRILGESNWGRVFQKQCGHPTDSDDPGRVVKTNTEDALKIETFIPVCGLCSAKYMLIGWKNSPSIDSRSEASFQELLDRHP